MVIKHKNININYSHIGNGEAVVLLHGFLENLSMWDNLVSDLESSYQVITIDLLGHGKTDCLGYIHTMEDMAEAVNAVLNELNIQKAHFIGHSMGGYVALALLEKIPNKALSVCLLNSTSEADSKDRQANRDRAIKAVKQNHKAFISMAISNLFAKNNRERLSSEIETVKQEALKTPLQGIIAALEGMKIRPNRTVFFKSLHCKKMIIYGLKDTVLDASSIKNLFHSTNIKLHEFPDGHMSHIENTKELSYLIMRFIE
ncbi:alpha/beta fold hydrolase [Mangrovimonas spongiae]|uniref:Alpha/beta hydrolase n=1 Tax=Mangrovimonas spongiae TaxID=2494697 RepID=A0A3R9MVI0_9FLAO|nr:alpha/beta hydrolase [Mangrovimonas spongiae]RSK41752.1 alpha/beta hydrolase [Mangrovimonas spongiae]